MASYRRRTVKGVEYWQLRWSEGGRECTQSLGRVSDLREGEVRSLAKAKAREVALGKHVYVGEHRRFADYSTEYLTWHQGEYPDSHWRIRQLVEDHIGPAFDAMTLGGITVLDVERWKRARLDLKTKSGETALKPATVGKELRTLRAMLTRAVMLGYIRSNVAQLVKEPRDVVDRSIVYFTPEELQKLYMASVVPWHWAAWMLFAGTGMRRGEGLALKWQQISRDNLTIISTGEERTKSGAARVVPLSSTARIALDYFREWPKRSDLYVLPRVDEVSLSRAAAKCIARAKLRGSLHTLRHTFASQLASDPRIPIRSIQEWMGHSTIAVTEKYMHFRQGTTDQLLRNMTF